MEPTEPYTPTSPRAPLTFGQLSRNAGTCAAHPSPSALREGDRSGQGGGNWGTRVSGVGSWGDPNPRRLQRRDQAGTQTVEPRTLRWPLCPPSLCIWTSRLQESASQRMSHRPREASAGCVPRQPSPPHRPCTPTVPVPEPEPSLPSI